MRVTFRYDLHRYKTSKLHVCLPCFLIAERVCYSTATIIFWSFIVGARFYSFIHIHVHVCVILHVHVHNYCVLVFHIPGKIPCLSTSK